MDERIQEVRLALKDAEGRLWKDLLVQTKWRSPLLVLDEAHHLKNADTALARTLQSADTEQDLQTGDGAMAHAFDRMLFLTATPFQLGHHELVSVLERFCDVRRNQPELPPREATRARLLDLRERLNESQRSAIHFQKCWSRLRPDPAVEVEAWWGGLAGTVPELLQPADRAAVEAYGRAKDARGVAETALRSWVLRNNKGVTWPDSAIVRRERRDGASVADPAATGGLPIPLNQTLPFFLAARSAVHPGRELLGEALCSSYEAFRDTRKRDARAKDRDDVLGGDIEDLSHSAWYLRQFDQAIAEGARAVHPKVAATVQRVVDLWETGEKVLVFAFYKLTCKALRVHISQEVERRLYLAGRRKFLDAGSRIDEPSFKQLVAKVRLRYGEGPGRRALDAGLRALIDDWCRENPAVKISAAEAGALLDVMRRFLRTHSTVARSFPLAEIRSIKAPEVVRRVLDYSDGSQMSWRDKFRRFLTLLFLDCTEDGRRRYVDAVRQTQTGGIRVRWEEEGAQGDVTLANVQVATGDTKRELRERLMQAFNTPFFPEIFVCSQVMGEGVDLQRYCRHVVHHDLDWNPSTIEQRTGRVDRLGSKAEGKQSIVSYLPYLAGTTDERQYHVMSERERWFRVVMGQDEVARLVRAEDEDVVPLPDAVARKLAFRLEVVPT